MLLGSSRTNQMPRKMVRDKWEWLTKFIYKIYLFTGQLPDLIPSYQNFVDEMSVVI